MRVMPCPVMALFFSFRKVAAPKILRVFTFRFNFEVECGIFWRKGQVNISDQGKMTARCCTQDLDTELATVICNLTLASQSESSKESSRTSDGMETHAG